MFSAIVAMDKKLYVKILEHLDGLCDYEFDSVEHNAIAFAVNKFYEIIGDKKSLIPFEQKLELILNFINKKMKDFNDPATYKMLRTPWFWEDFKYSLTKMGF